MQVILNGRQLIKLTVSKKEVRTTKVISETSDYELMKEYP